MFEPMIGPGSEVTLHFSLTLEDGTVIDSNFDRCPATFSLGDGSLPPGFEHFLIGLKTGACEIFTVSPGLGFGDFNPDNVHRISRRQFAADLPLTPGLVVSFADANRAEVAGVVVSLDDEYVEVDFNHPLAGRTVLFQVKIAAVRDRRINLVEDWEPSRDHPGSIV